MKCAPLIFLAIYSVTCADKVLADARNQVSRVLEPGRQPADSRLGRPRTLNDKYHPWAPPATKAAWEKQAKAIRERVLVSSGLWPMPPKEPLKPVIHGRVDRGEYTVEKVFFASFPGHYVSGNLYRPTHRKGKVPGVLCPHGHWKDGRFYDAGEKEAHNQLQQGAEKDMAGARFPLQARMAELARLGCVVFHYDMVGMADSRPIGHAAGFADAEAELRLQSALGLQTFNSIRALDFLTSLPDVDAKRIGVTGASGGGTQTFLLGAVDPRPTVAFPAVMVSTAMQGGCVCENVDHLRVGISNIAIAALFAPKPLAMSGANDWTIDIESKGLPELKQVYSLYGSADKVHAKCFRQFGHNYNRVSRQMMDDWFNAHLGLGQASPIVEQDFWPIDPKDLSVFDHQHPRPADAKSAPELRKTLTAMAEKQFAELLPQNSSGLERYREVVGTAARVILNATLPDPEAIRVEVTAQKDLGHGIRLSKGLIARDDDKTQLPWILLRPDSFKGTVVLWLDGGGKSHLFGDDGKPSAPVQKLLSLGDAVASVDLFLTGEFLQQGKTAERPHVNAKYAGFTFGYNPTLLADRVHDVLTAVADLRKSGEFSDIVLIGTGHAGPPALFAAGFLRDQVGTVIADACGLSYEKLPPANDPNFLPGALKYGGLGGLAALAVPTPLQIYGAGGIPPHELAPLTRAQWAARELDARKSHHGRLEIVEAPLQAETVVANLIAR